MLFSFYFFMIFISLNLLYYKNLSLLMMLVIGLYMIMYNCEFEYSMYWFYIDLMGQSLVILTFFIIFLMNLYDYKNNNLFMFVIEFLLLLALVYCFYSNSLMMLYVFFEISLIPLMILILIKGNSPERIISSLYLMLYTLSGSLPLLLLFVSMSEINFSIVLVKFMMLNFNEGLIWNMMLIVFLIKMPMYGVHLWLPKAHVEAPVTGSMILAGLLLKLGGFGLYRLVYFMSFMTLKYYKLFFFLISLLGGFLIGCVCFRQIDIKMLVAYSSVTHMGMVLSGIFSLSVLGAMGVLGGMLGHGFCSSGLFYMANCFYERYKTRSMSLIKGSFQIYPVFLYWWMIFSMINMGVPPFMNFFFELILVYSILKVSVVMLIIVSMILMVSVFYSLCLYTRLGHGNLWGGYWMMGINKLEMLVILVHFLPLILYLFNIFIVMEWLM